MIDRPDTREFRVDSAASIAYGPLGPDVDEWELRFWTVEEERVSVAFDEAAMYELWTEVHNVPWPRDGTDRTDLAREVVALAEGAGEETLREVLAVLQGEQDV